eukprot:COSAG05_NODE_17450_length_325_cov_0.681416_1_plen_75_part_10
MIEWCASLSLSLCRYDLNSDGVLSEDEVSQMMIALGFKVETSYVAEMMATFGQYPHTPTTTPPPPPPPPSPAPPP